jgi:hypothetical protein
LVFDSPSAGDDLAEDEDGADEVESSEGAEEAGEFGFGLIRGHWKSNNDISTVHDAGEDISKDDEQLHLLSQHQSNLPSILQKYVIIQPRILYQYCAYKDINLWKSNQKSSHSNGESILAIYPSKHGQQSDSHGGAEQSQHQLTKHVHHVILSRFLGTGE